MIQVTPLAAKHLVEVRNGRGFGRTAGARFLPQGHGVGMSFARVPEPGDTVIAAIGIDIFIAQELASKLEGSTIDISATDGKTDLVLRPPRKGASA